MYLSQQAVANYDRDGFVLVEEVFSPEEVSIMLQEVKGSARVAASTFEREGRTPGGKKAKLAIWYDLLDDVWSAASTNPQMVNNARILMREEIAFFHGKVMLKEARSGGAWEWHQDYGYWYDQGFAFPRMMSAFVALDPATKANGCLQVLRGSHLLGRVSHGKVGDQTGIDLERVEKLEPLFERVHCEMQPGAVLFFHSNLLHTSADNPSDHSRYSFIIAYNALNNPQLTDKKTSQQHPCPVSSPDTILKFGVVGAGSH